MNTRYDYGYTQEVIECLDTVDFNTVEHDIPYKGVTPEEYKNKLLSWDYEGYTSGAYVGKDFGCILFNRRSDEKPV